MNTLTVLAKTLKKLLKASPVETALVGLMALALMITLVPAFAFADQPQVDPNGTAKEKALNLQISAMQNDLVPFGTLPGSDLRGPAYTIVVPSTAYNSLPGQTDSTPFITASGTHTRWGVVAANFLPMGTRIRIPELYGDQIFIVEDRMNARYWKRVDVWMESYTDARAYGVRHIAIEVYPNK